MSAAAAVCQHHAEPGESAAVTPWRPGWSAAGLLSCEHCYRLSVATVRPSPLPYRTPTTVLSRPCPLIGPSLLCFHADIILFPDHSTRPPRCISPARRSPPGRGALYSPASRSLDLEAREGEFLSPTNRSSLLRLIVFLL